MIIRKITTAEAPLWRDIRLEALATAPKAFASRLEDWADRPIADFAARIAATHIFLAFDGDRPVGCISWSCDEDPAMPRRGWVESVFVSPAVRGKGTAQALITAILTDAAAAGMTEIFLEVGAANKAAQSAYQRAGFQAITGSDRPQLSCGVCEITMRRDL